MVDFTEDQKKEIFDRMADEHTTPDVLAKELKCKLADIMDAVVDVITSRGEAKTYIPETSLDDGDDMVEAEAPKAKKEAKSKKPQGKKEKSVKWSDVLGVKADKQNKSKTETDDTINDFLGGFGIKVQKVNLDDYPALKKATDTLVNAFTGESAKQEELKTECPCKKQHDPISVDKLGALAYRLSKLHMSEDLIVKVLNITLGVPEPTIREALN